MYNIVYDTKKSPENDIEAFNNMCMPCNEFYRCQFGKVDSVTKCLYRAVCILSINTFVNLSNYYNLLYNCLELTL